MAQAENKKKTTPKLSWNQVSRFGLNFQRRKKGDSTGSLQTTLSSLYFNFAMWPFVKENWNKKLFDSFHGRIRVLS